jgi:SAM-dependent methyltransferase
VSGLSYNKVCNVEDFRSPELQRVLRRELPHEVRRFGDTFPSGREHRKDWETAMTIRTFEDMGFLDGRRDFLGVAAGTEALIFCLTRHAHRVFATDRYLEAGTWEPMAPPTMLTQPGRYWPSDWNPRRLVVQHMDGLDLLYDDESFDGIFSSSSVEHFGDHGALHRAMDEIFRVLKPGGIATLSTEYRISGEPPGFPGTLMFDDAELHEHIVGNRPWELISPFDPTVSGETLRSAADTAALVAEQDAQTERDGGWFPFRAEYSSYPVIALVSPYGHVSNTMHLALRKKRRNPLARVLPRKVVSLGRRLRRSGPHRRRQ